MFQTLRKFFVPHVTESQIQAAVALKKALDVQLTLAFFKTYGFHVTPPVGTRQDN